MTLAQEKMQAYARRKADQEWELAGCARVDGDAKDCQRHTLLARMWEAVVRGEGEFPCV